MTLALLFVVLAADSPLAITHCSDSLSEALRTQLPAPTEPVAITCTHQAIFVAAHGHHETVEMHNCDDAALAALVDQALARIESRPTVLPAALPMPAEPEPPFVRTTELWIQPLGTPVAAAVVGSAYVSVGVTVDILPKWELVNSFGFLVGHAVASAGDEDVWADTLQLWFTSAFVHLWRLPVGGPRSGFFLGPKLTLAITHSNLGNIIPETALGIEVGYEAGFRFQVSHFDLTLTVPSVSVGYQHNRPNTITVFDLNLNDSKDGIGFDTDFNLVRVGVSF